MKKLILVAAIILVTGVTFGQTTLKKGMVVALSSYELVLKDNVTLQQFINFNEQKYIPEAEKAMPGTKLIMLWGDRGENKFRYGEMWVFDNAAIRDKYFPAENDTATSPAMKAVMEKLKAISDESSKYILNAKRVYTDWLVK
jgi:hypothetical protein